MPPVVITTKGRAIVRLTSGAIVSERNLKRIAVALFRNDADAVAAVVRKLQLSTKDVAELREVIFTQFIDSTSREPVKPADKNTEPKDLRET